MADLWTVCGTRWCRTKYLISTFQSIDKSFKVVVFDVLVLSKWTVVGDIKTAVWNPKHIVCTCWSAILWRFAPERPTLYTPIFYLSKNWVPNRRQSHIWATASIVYRRISVSFSFNGLISISCVMSCVTMMICRLPHFIQPIFYICIEAYTVVFTELDLCEGCFIR